MIRYHRTEVMKAFIDKRKERVYIIIEKGEEPEPKAGKGVMAIFNELPPIITCLCSRNIDLGLHLKLRLLSKPTKV